jgi:hypothetical protein
MAASSGQPAVGAAEFKALYERLQQAPPWGPADPRGGLSYLAPNRVLAAAREIRQGRTVSLAAPIETDLTPDQPEPAVHDMKGRAGADADPDGLTFAQDGLGINVHGDADSHIDALCHAMCRRTLYNQVPSSVVTGHGAGELSIDVARDGIVGRGVPPGTGRSSASSLRSGCLVPPAPRSIRSRSSRSGHRPDPRRPRSGTWSQCVLAAVPSQLGSSRKAAKWRGRH